MHVPVALAEELAGKVPQRIGYLDRETMATLGIEPGDPVAVGGDSGTVLSAKLHDGSNPRLFVDEIDARNAGVSSGDSVEIAAVDLSVADRVAVASVESATVKGAEEPVTRAIESRPVSLGDELSVSALGGSVAAQFVVDGVDPESPGLVTEATRIDIVDRGDEDAFRPTVGLGDIGGYDDAVAELRAAVTGDAAGPGGGVLVHGPSGVGKTHLVSAVAAASDARLLRISPASDEFDGRLDAEAVRSAATGAGPTLLFLDGLQTLAPGGSGRDTTGDRSAAAVGELLDALGGNPNVTVVAATRNPDDVAASVRRGDRLSWDLGLAPPDRAERASIIEVHLGNVVLGPDVDVGALGAQTAGFLGADLVAVVAAARRAARDRAGSDADDPALTADDFEAALASVEPAGTREYGVERPDIDYDEIGGLTEVKRELIRAVEWPLRYPELFETMRSDPPKGLLLYGPPGTGKTMLARAVASSGDANFLAVDGPELFDRYVGESERAVRDVFERARRHSPTVIFFDEIDALASTRGSEGEADVSERVVSQMLTELDGIGPREDVVVIAATNRPDVVDPALLRPGRFEKTLEVPLPDREARAAIFDIHLGDVPHEGVDPDDLAARTEGYSGGDVEAVVREASMLAMEEYLQSESFDPSAATLSSLRVGSRHLDEALESVGRSVDERSLERYQEIADGVGR